jgi:Ca-activated chloride channel family protein
LIVASCLLAGGCRKGPEPHASPPASSAAPVKLTFTYGSEKQAWVEEVTAAFEATGPRTAAGAAIEVEAVPLGSGELVDELATGRREPDLISPASSAFLELANAAARARTGRELVSSTQSLVLSPVVIAMWRPMAVALGWPERAIGWEDVLALAGDSAGWAARGRPEWGAFRFGHTHPRFSNSGLISLLAEIYAGAGKVTGLTAADLERPEVASFVRGIEQSVIHYGSSTGFFGRQMFGEGPSYLSAAVLYESSVVESYAKPRQDWPVVAIYPREGTFWSDHPVGIVDRDWVSPARREAAKLYLDFLLAPAQQARALAHGFRPGDPRVALGAPIDASHGVDPGQPTTTLPVPSSELLSRSLELWQRNKKHAHVVLALDVSGSMQDDGKMAAAREAARELVASLDDADLLSVVVFNNQARWLVRRGEVSTVRVDVDSRVSGLLAAGGTALYDAMSAGLDDFAASSSERIAALVVLSDGDDRDSRQSLEALLTRVASDDEHAGVRVFTVAYGADARQDVLARLAEASRGKAYTGTTSSIRDVFRDISTFF